MNLVFKTVQEYVYIRKTGEMLNLFPDIEQNKNITIETFAPISGRLYTGDRPGNTINNKNGKPELFFSL